MNIRLTLEAEMLAAHDLLDRLHVPKTSNDGQHYTVSQRIRLLPTDWQQLAMQRQREIEAGAAELAKALDELRTLKERTTTTP